jgi:hypothetical protein
MLDLDPIDCGGLASREVEEEIAAVCGRRGIKEKIVRLRLTALSREAYRSLSRRMVGELRAEALPIDFPAAIREEVLGYGTNLMAHISERRRTERFDAPQ